MSKKYYRIHTDDGEGIKSKLNELGSGATIDVKKEKHPSLGDHHAHVVTVSNGSLSLDQEKIISQYQP